MSRERKRNEMIVTDETDELAINTDGSINSDSTLQTGSNLIGKVKMTDGTDEASVITNTDDDTNLDGENGVVSSSILYGRIDSSTIKPIRIDASTHSVQMISYEHHEIHGGSHYYIEGSTTLANAGVLRANIITPSGTKWSHFTWKISSNGILTSNLYECVSGAMGNGARVTIHANNRNKNCWCAVQDGGDGQAILTDSSQSWTPDELIGLQCFNQTDGSSGFITDNTATTVTVTLAGGTDNDFDDDDVIEINNSQMIINSGVDAATTNGLLISTASVGGTGWKADVGGEAARTDELVLKENATYLRIFTSGSDANIVSFKASWYEHTDKD